MSKDNKTPPEQKAQKLRAGMSNKSKAMIVGAAMLAMSASALEPAFATGIYHDITLVGPRDECRAEYIQLRDQLVALCEMRFTDRVLFYLKNGEKAGDVAAEIRLRMNSMEEVKWTDVVAQNLVTTVGGNAMLDNHLSGSSYTAAWYMGLVSGSGSPTYAAGDTMASHSGWTEFTAYSQSTRPAPSWSSAASKSKATSSAVQFSINADSSSIAGCFLATASTKSGTTGTLFSVGAFTGGTRSANNGDTLNVSYTASV